MGLTSLENIGRHYRRLATRLLIFFLIFISPLYAGGVEELPASLRVPVSKPYSITKSASNQPPLTMGWLEKVHVGEARLPITAKLDTGAKTSSVGAQILKTYERDNREYILYRLMSGDMTSEAEKKLQTFESPITRWVRIKTKKGDGYIRRPVVMMQFCIADRLILEEVNLSNRAHFNYPILIGRNMLEGHIVVDVSKTLTRRPRCKMSES